MNNNGFSAFKKAFKHYTHTILMGCFLFCSYLLFEDLSDDLSTSIHITTALWIVLGVVIISSLISLPLLIPLALYYYYIYPKTDKKLNHNLIAAAGFFVLGNVWSIVLHFWFGENLNNLLETMTRLSPYSIAAASSFLLIEFLSARKNSYGSA